MKNYRFLSAIAVALPLLLISCKKGDDDPFFSLRSRKARVAGEWKVSEFHGIQTQTFQNGYIQGESNYNGSNVSIVTTYSDTNQQPELYTYELSQAYTFEKDGTYTAVERTQFNTRTETGTWTFLPKSKEDDLSKKEAIVLYVRKVTHTNGSNTQNFTGFDEGETYVIRELRNKKMVWTVESSGPNGATQIETSAEITLTQD
jgi:hypothetical protein